MSARSTTQDLDDAIAIAASKIPGSRIEFRPAVEFPTIGLPIPGLAVRFKLNDGAPTMHLWREGRSRGWVMVPTVARNYHATGRRIAIEIETLVRIEIAKAPMQRERDDGRRLTTHVGLWLSPLEITAARLAAHARGMTVAGILRLGLRLAVDDQAESDCDEGKIRNALRLLIASKRGVYPDNFAAIAESGSVDDVTVALRVAFRTMPDGEAAADLLGVGWITDKAQRRAEREALDACEG